MKLGKSWESNLQILMVEALSEKCELLKARLAKIVLHVNA